MLSGIVFLFFSAVEPVVVHSLLFSENGIFSFESLVIFFQAFLLLSVLFTLNRKLIAGFLTLNTLLAAILLVWHAHFSEPLTLQVMASQLHEGLAYAGGAIPGMLTLPMIGVWLFWLLQMVFLARFWHGLPYRNYFRWIPLVPLLVVIALTVRTFYRVTFSYTDFKYYSRTFGYAYAWSYELLSSLQSRHLIDEIVASANQPVPPRRVELKGLQLPRHLFLVQVESLDYEAFTKEIGGRPLMPFLNQLAQHSYLYEIAPRLHRWSSNTDFSVLVKASNTDKFYFSIYKLFEQEDYQRLRTLPQKAEALGYQPVFYHGYTWDYYNRKPNLEASGFKKLWFLENLPAALTRGYWGVDDAELVDFILSENAAGSQPQLNYVVTVSSHSDYEIALRHRKPYRAPKTELEKYYNAVNYVDQALQKLVEKAPAESLFIFFSDHPTELVADTRTLLLIYQKNHSRAYHGQINFSELPPLIHSLFEYPSQP